MGKGADHVRAFSFRAVDAELFEERAIFKIGTPVRIEGIGISLDLTVSVDFGFEWIDQFSGSSSI
jgi:hypothetical protein